MGLFLPDPAADLGLFKDFLGATAAAWNGTQGVVYEHQVALASEEELEAFIKLADEVMAIHFPKRPSAFKRLGAWLVLSQYRPPFNFSNGNGVSPHQADCDWTPRFALLWMLAAASQMTVITEEEDIPLQAFSLPSPHFQVELISVLRHYRLQAVKAPGLISHAMLAERAFNASLIVESAYYVHTLENPSPEGVAAHHVQGKIEGCLKNFNATQLTDIAFSDEDKLFLMHDDGVR
jgi:hypothetical protein